MTKYKCKCGKIHDCESFTCACGRVVKAGVYVTAAAIDTAVDVGVGVVDLLTSLAGSALGVFTYGMFDYDDD